MTVDSIDIEVQSGAPIHLFEIYYEGDYYRFTNHPDKVTALTYDWSPKNISMGEVEVTEDINKNNIDLIFPRDDTFATLYISGIQDDVSTVTIYRGYQNDPDAEWIAYWKGRFSSSTIKKNQIILVCESVFTSMKRPGIRGKFSKHCRHTLYGRGCNISLSNSDYYVEDTVDSVSADGLTYSISAASLQSNGYYFGGMLMSPDGVYRFIRGHSGSSITISKPFSDNTSEGSYRLYAGCNRTMSVCVSRFNNLANYGGFPYTPDFNPMGGGRLR